MQQGCARLDRKICEIEEKCRNQTTLQELQSMIEMTFQTSEKRMDKE